MRTPKKELDNTTNTTVYRAARRQLETKCSFCKPNKGENTKRKSKHGNKKRKYKDKRR